MPCHQPHLQSARVRSIDATTVIKYRVQTKFIELSNRRIYAFIYKRERECSAEMPSAEVDGVAVE